MRLQNFLIILLFVFSSVSSFSQVNMEQEELIETAKDLFNDGEYRKAMPLYSQLLSLYPSEAVYSFYYGACLVENNKEIDKAIKYLSYGIRKKIDYPLVYYYLGRAYHLSYQFDKAIEQYKIYQSRATTKSQKERQIEREITICSNGLDLIKYSSQLIVLDNKKINQNNFQYSYDLKKIGGKLVVKPDQFKTKADLKQNAKELIFITDSGKVFFSSLGDQKNGDRDIYWTEKNELGEFLPSKNIGDIINTPFDEDYPFLKADEKTLYFCSKGHNTMGGYDIFKSEYDTIAKTWTTPVNLDFPTNTPYDDLLYVVDADDNLAYFASNRESHESKLNVYKILVDKNPVEQEINSLEEIQQLAKLKITPLADLPQTDEYKANAVATTKIVEYESTGPKTEFSFDEVYANHISDSEDYTKILRQDLKQLKKNLSKTEAKSILASNIAHSKLGKLREIESQVETRKNTLSTDEQLTDETLKKLIDESVKINAQAYISAKTSEALNKEIIVRKREIKITEMLLNDSANNSTQELVQNINANRKFLQQNNKSYLSLKNWTREKERENVLLEQKIQRAQEQYNKSNVSFNRALEDFQISEKDFQKAKEIQEITETKKALNIAKENLSISKNEVVETSMNLKLIQAEKQRIDEEMIFLNTINTELSDTKNQQLANNNQTFDHQLILDNAEAFNTSILDLQTENISLSVNSEFDEKTAGIFDVQDNLLAEDIANNKSESKANTPTTSKNSTPVDTKEDAPKETPSQQQDDKTTTSKTEGQPKADVSPKKDNIKSKKIKTEIISIDLAQVYSLEARQKYNEAKQNTQLADSLLSLASEKAKRVNFIPNTEQQEIIKNEIEELKQLSEIKVKQSEIAYQEAVLIEQTFRETNPTDTILEAIMSKQLFASTSNKNNTPKLIEYKKAAFKELYYQQEFEELQRSIRVIEDNLDNENLSIKDREQLQSNLTVQTKQEKILKDKISQAKEIQLSLKDNIIADNTSYSISKEEAKYPVSDVSLSNKLKLSKQQQKELKTIHKDQAEAKTIYSDWETKLEQIRLLEDSLQKTNNNTIKEELRAEIGHTTKEAWNNFNKAEQMQKDLNAKTSNLLKNLLETERTSYEKNDASQAYVLEKESDLLLKKADVLRLNTNSRKQYNETTVELLEKANRYEKLTINKQKEALEIYAEINAKHPKQEELIANVNTPNEPQKDNEFNSEATEVKAVMTELLPNEDEKVEEYNKLYKLSTAKQTKAEDYWSDVEESKQKLETIFAQKDLEKQKAKIQKQDKKAKLTFHEAYQIKQEANQKKYNLYRKKTENAINISTNKTKKSIAQQNILDAEFYFEEAQKIKIDSLQSTNNLRAQHQQKLELENEAIKSQELAYAILTNTENNDFLSTGTIVKINPNETKKDTIDIDLIQKLQSQRILNRLELTSYEAKQLTKAEKLKKEKEKLTTEYLANKTTIEELNDSLPKITNEKQWKKVDSEISNLDAKSLSFLFSIAQTTEPINYEKYMVYKNHIKEYRIKDKSKKAVEGRTLEKDANKAFRKAQNLRSRSFEVVSVDRAYNMLMQAGDLEKEALENMEQAYALYMDLAPIEEDVAKYLAENTDTNKIGVHGYTIIESEGQVEAYNTPEIIPVIIPEISNDTNESKSIVNIEADSISTTIDTLYAESNSIDTLFIEPKNFSDTIVKTELLAENTEGEAITDTSLNNKETSIKNEEKINNTKTLDNVKSITEATNTSLLFTPKSIYSKDNPIPINNPIPDGIVYKIQIGAFTKPIPQNSFQGLTPITGETRQNSKYIRYFVGLFNTYEAANTALPYIKNSGYTDAFIVAYKDGQRIAVYLAKKENQKQENYQQIAQTETQAVLKTVNNNADQIAGNTPMQKVNPSINLTELEGTLYTVQIGAYKTHVPHARLKNLSPLYNDVTASGLIRYFVGRYVDFNEANQRKNNIRKAGIKDAFVTAFKNGKKISINQARKELAGVNALEKNTTDKKDLNNVKKIASANSKPNYNSKTLYYRVQIGAYSNTVPVQVVSSFVQMSKLDQLDRFINPEGKTVYTIGRFKSLSEANLLKQDLVESGITDAFIIAFDGQVKVPIEEAKKVLLP